MVCLDLAIKLSWFLTSSRTKLVSYVRYVNDLFKSCKIWTIIDQDVAKIECMFLTVKSDKKLLLRFHKTVQLHRTC